MLNAEKLLQYGPVGLFVVSFFESIFFPVPPDVLLLPLSLMRPQLSFWYSLLTTFASVSGAFVGYLIGMKAGRPIVEHMFSRKRVQEIEALFARYGSWAVGIAAFTPIPFKLFTLGAGIFRVGLWPFFVASVLGRGGRFFLEASLVFFLGDRARAYLGRNFEMTTLGLTLAVIFGTWFLPRLGRSAIGKRRKIASGTLLKSTVGRCVSWIRAKGSVFVAYLTVSMGSLFMLMATLEDALGPERKLLNETIGKVMEPVGNAVSPASGLWQTLGDARLETAVFLSSFAYLFFKTFPRDSSTSLSSHRVRLALTSLCLAGLVCFLEYVLGSVFSQAETLWLLPEGQLTIAPAVISLSTVNLTTGLRKTIRVVACVVSAALGVSIACFRVAAWNMEPVLAWGSLVAGLFLASGLMAALRSQKLI